MNSSQLLFRTDDRKAIITLNRPSKRNALTDTMLFELSSAIATAGRDANVKAIILCAEGSSFCVGPDVEYLQRVAENDHEQNLADSARVLYLFRTMYELRKPIIAAVQGPAIAEGCALATACDFVLAAADNARFGCTEAQIGLVPAIVMPFLMKRVGEGRARELVLRANVIDAAEAARIGLATAVVPDADLMVAAGSLADELISRNSATSMAYCKELTAKLHGMNLQDALEFASNVNAAARMTADGRQGVESFLNKTTTTW